MNEYQIIYNKQKDYFLSKITYSYKFRKEMLKKLKQMIVDNKEALVKALKCDLNKTEYESYMCEIGLVLHDLSYAIKHLKRWMKIEKVKTNISNFPSKSYITHDPYGVCLIMSPWNYPINLVFEPLIGCIAGGNTSIIKMSEYSINTSKLLVKLINENFDEGYLKAYMGDVTETTAILDLPFDFIFFTGSKKVGQIVMEKASKHLTPVVLELGGKSPVIVTNDASLDKAAKRIVFGKILNAGQTCVAPDYLYVNEDIKNQLIEKIILEIEKALGKNPLENSNYPKIINSKNLERITKLIDYHKVIYGGKHDQEKIEPTLIDNVNDDDLIMQEEIFGPILPIMTYRDIDEVIKYIESKDAPLALYLFTNDKKTIKKVLQLRFGGGCINDTIMHLSSDTLPFGGVGGSGIGVYHGKFSFDTFTRKKGILQKSNKIDIKLRYYPYNKKKQKIINKILK